MSERTSTPRSGGRTAEARSYRTEGSAALKPETVTIEKAPRLRVAPPAPIQAPRAPFIAVVLLLVVAGVVGILLINTRTNENSFKLSRLQDQQAALDNQQQNLDNQIAGYESTGNLDAAARRLGLVKADTPAYIRLPDGRVIGVPRPGQGPTAVTAQDPAAAPSGAAATPPDGDAANGVTANGATAANGTTAGSTAAVGTTADGTTANGTTANGSTGQASVENGAVLNGTVQGGQIPAGQTQVPQIAGQ